MNPVHSLEEMRLLMERFPNEIEFVGGLIGGNLEGGLVNFKSPSTWHNQYTASSEIGKKFSVLDCLFDDVFDKAYNEDISFFDFGVSTEQGGRILNSGLFDFKNEFGGGGVCYDHYLLDLKHGHQ